MLPAARAYTLRLATADDEPALRRLAEIDSQDPLTATPVLLGEIDGRPEAALSLADGRTVANPFVPTALLLAHLRMRAGALAAYEHTPSLAARIRAAMSAVVPTAAGAPAA